MDGRDRDGRGFPVTAAPTLPGRPGRPVCTCIIRTVVVDGLGLRVVAVRDDDCRAHEETT